MSAPEGYDDAQWHVDAIADTGVGWYATKGWHLRCAWCEWTVQASTKREAVAAYRVHEQERFAAFTLASSARSEADHGPGKS